MIANLSSLLQKTMQIANKSPTISRMRTSKHWSTS